jgi:hypothetical protein
VGAALLGFYPAIAASLSGHFFGLLFFGPAKKSDSRLGRGTKRPLRKRQPGDIAQMKAKVTE